MRSDATSKHCGFYHQALLYDTDDEFLDAVVPFLAGGVEAGEPTLVALDSHDTDAVRMAMPDLAGVTFVPAGHRYVTPAGTIEHYRLFLADHVAAGATQIRILGAVPHAGTSSLWDGWARYEAAINRVYDEYPLWGVCPYDTRTTPEAVIADVERTHPQLSRNGQGQYPNGRYQDPRTFLTSRAPSTHDPIEATPPSLHLADPVPADARRALHDLARRTVVDAEAVHGLVLAADEILVNAILYGKPPVELRAWAAGDRLVVAVSDKGTGPDDPFIGLVPATSNRCGGRGLWIAHQTCAQVILDRTDGFSIHLTAGTPH